MIDNPIIFYIASFILIIFALISMFAKNIVYSLLASIMVFFAAALFFYVLGSEYNAIIQAAIYGFAVPIIIALAIMFTSGGKSGGGNFALKYTAVLASAIFCLGFVYVIMISISMIPDTFNLTEKIVTNSYDVISSFAKGIFVNYVWAFELVSLLLTVIIAGFTLFKVKRTKGGVNDKCD